jgi:hypothetical protein
VRVEFCHLTAKTSSSKTLPEADNPLFSGQHVELTLTESHTFGVLPMEQVKFFAPLRMTMLLMRWHPWESALEWLSRPQMIRQMHVPREYLWLASVGVTEPGIRWLWRYSPTEFRTRPRLHRLLEVISISQ